jgi:hypothetical protein
VKRKSKFPDIHITFSIKIHALIYQYYADNYIGQIVVSGFRGKLKIFWYKNDSCKANNADNNMRWA